MTRHTAFLFTIAALAAAPAIAAPTVTSFAYGLKADLRIAGGTVAAVAATPVASGNAPAAYNRSGTVAAISQSARLADGLVTDSYDQIGTGLITGHASSTWPVTLAGAADVSVANLGVRLTSETDLALGVLRTLGLGLDAQLLTSSTSVGVGASGALVSTHASAITGLSLSSELLSVITANAAIQAGTAANTTIRLAGIELIVNEQKDIRTGTSDLLAYTNALRLTLSDFVLGGSLLSGEIIVGHSEAAISGFQPAAAAVPEPATWAMLILGFGLAGAAMRRRQTGGQVAA